jgi:hypothetical protein
MSGDLHIAPKFGTPVGSKPAAIDAKSSMAIGYNTPAIVGGRTVWLTAEGAAALKKLQAGGGSALLGVQEKPADMATQAWEKLADPSTRG